MPTLRFLAFLVLTLLGLTAPAYAAGLTPAQLHTAYDLPRTAPGSPTIAVVVAYDAPKAESDLAAFSRRFGIGACRSTGARPCLRKVNQRGDARGLPITDPSGRDWIVEAALGTQAARAICQNCRILLVETDSSSKADLSAGVETAVRLGAREVATAFSPPELPSDAGYMADYSHPGVVVTAAAGDLGYTGEPSFPADLPSVVAVGGTRLTLGRAGRYVSERAWARGGSGCSSVFSAPVWQAGTARALGCGTGRAVADVAAVADPGLLVHIGTPIDGRTGWFEAAGTSLASPLVAATFALAGGVRGDTTGGERLHAASGGLHDIVAGSNGSCSGRAICAARRGPDGPTGVGSPKGLLAFAAPGTLLDPARPRVSVRGGGGVGRDGRIRLVLANANAFAVRATMLLRSADRRVLGRATVRLHARSRARVLLRLTQRGRALVHGRGTLHALLEAALTGPRGSRAALRSGVTLTRP